MWYRIRDRIRSRRILAAAREPFWLVLILQRKVMNLVPLVQMPQQIKCPNAPAAVRRMQEDRTNPQNLHKSSFSKRTWVAKREQEFYGMILGRLGPIPTPAELVD